MRSTLISLHPSQASLATLCVLPFLIASASKAQAPAPPSANLPIPVDTTNNGVAAMQSLLTPRVEIEFQDIPVTDLLIQIAKLGGVEIAIRGDVGGTLKFVRYKNVTAEEAIERVASDAGLFWGKRGDQYVVARILEDLPYELQLKYRNAGQSNARIGSNNGAGNSGNSVPAGFSPPIPDFPPPPGSDQGIGLVDTSIGTARQPNPQNFMGIPELFDKEQAKKRDKTTNVIKMKNVTAAMIAYWLDPVNNAPDFATQRSNQAKEAATDERTLRPVSSFENFSLLDSAYGRSQAYPGAYPYPAQPYGYPGGAGYGTPYGAPYAPNGAPYGMPYNNSNPYIIGNSNGNPIYNGVPTQTNNRTRPTDFSWGGNSFPHPKSPIVQQLLRQNNVWTNEVTNSNPWVQRPFIQASPQFGGGRGGRNNNNNNNNNRGGRQGQGGFGGGGGQQAAGVFDLPTGIDSMVAIDAQNVLLVRGTAEAVEELQQLIELIDQPLKQVEIEAQFVTLTNSDAKFFGIDFSGSALPFTLSSTTNPNGIAGNTNLGIVNRNFQVTLNNLVTQARAKIVTAPRVVAINNLTASLQSQTITTILLPQSAINAGGNGNNVVATAQVPFQIQTSIGLTVTPTINGDGTITVLMQPQVQQQGTPTASNPVPTVSSQFVNTVAIVRDGDTIALGGLRNKSIQNTKNKIPFLSNIPIIGKLFTSLDKSERDEDLIIFLTARVLHRLDDTQAVPGT